MNNEWLEKEIKKLAEELKILTNKYNYQQEEIERLNKICRNIKTI